MALVEVKGLRIVAAREGLDLLGREGVAAELGALADRHVLEVSHGAASVPIPKFANARGNL